MSEEERQKLKAEQELKLRKLKMWDGEISIPIPSDYKLFRPGHEPADGYYLTLRLRPGRLYQVANEFKDGKWMMESTDGSVTVAYTSVPDYFYTLVSEITEIDRILKTKDEE